MFLDFKMLVLLLIYRIHHFSYLYNVNIVIIIWIFYKTSAISQENSLKTNNKKIFKPIKIKIQRLIFIFF